MTHEAVCHLIVSPIITCGLVFVCSKDLGEKAQLRVNYFLVYRLKVGHVDGSSVNMIKVEPSN